MKRQLIKILGLKGVVVKSQKVIEDSLILEIEKESKTAICPRCHQKSHRLHQGALSNCRATAVGSHLKIIIL